MTEFDEARLEMANTKELDIISEVTIGMVEKVRRNVESGEYTPEQAAEVVAAVTKGAVARYFRMQPWKEATE